VTSNLDHLRQEVMTMKLCRHKNVLPRYTSFNVKRELWLVMPYMDKGSMHEAMRQLKKAGKNAELDEEWIAAVLKETCQGLVYLHKSGWVHRDVKAGNILINSAGDVMLSDFGVAGILMNPDPLNQENNRNTFVGTPCWMAPEVMKQSSGYTEKADIWSLGITALELAKSYAPYAKERTMKVLLRTLQEPPPTLKTYAEYGDTGKKVGDFGSAFKDFYSSCLVKDPKKRPDGEKLLKKSFVTRCKDPAASLQDLLLLLPSVGDVADVEEGKEAEKEAEMFNEETSKGVTGGSLDEALAVVWVDPDKEEGHQQFTCAASTLKEQIEEGRAAAERAAARTAAATGGAGTGAGAGVMGGIFAPPAPPGAAARVVEKKDEKGKPEVRSKEGFAAAFGEGFDKNDDDDEE